MTPKIDAGVEQAKLKGKFMFSSAKFDQVTLTGTIKLPGGLDLSQTNDFSLRASITEETLNGYSYRWHRSIDSSPQR